MIPAVAKTSLLTGVIKAELELYDVESVDLIFCAVEDRTNLTADKVDVIVAVGHV